MNNKRMLRKRSRINADLDPLPRIVPATQTRSDNNTDALTANIENNIEPQSKCKKLLKDLSDILIKGSWEYQRKHNLSWNDINFHNGENGPDWNHKTISVVENVSDLLTSSQILKELKEAISAGTNDQLSFLSTNIIEYILDFRVLQLMEYLLKNKMTSTFELNDDLSYKDIMNMHLLWYVSLITTADDFCFENDVNKLLNDITNKFNINWKYFVNRLLFHRAMRNWSDGLCHIDDQNENTVSSMLLISKVIEKYYDANEWDLYMVTLPHIQCRETLKQTKREEETFEISEDFEDTMYNGGFGGRGKKNDLHWMVDDGITWEIGSAYLPSWWKYVVMHNKKENEMCVFWSAIQAD